MACKQCELLRVKGVVVKKCGARQSKSFANASIEVKESVWPIEVVCNDIDNYLEPETELLSEITDIDNEEAE